MFINPKHILTDFLRYRLTDPRDRAEDTNTESFNGGGTEFSLTPPSGSLSCIILIQVDSTDQTKWKDYYIDFQNQKVIFYSATAAGTNNVEVTYKYGSTNWIYPDKAKKTLSKTAFPRVNILTTAGTGSRLGQYNSNMESSVQFQIDIWTKENQPFTIGSLIYEGDELAEYIGYQVTKAFEDYIDDLHPQMYNYELLSVPRDMGYNVEMECFHVVVEVQLNSIDAGES